MDTMEKEREIGARIEKVSAAVNVIVRASHEWSNEMRTEISSLTEKKRLDFVVRAGRAMAELGDFIAAAGDAQ
jgi:hypothetical protein